jgi:ribosomal protein S5
VLEDALIAAGARVQKAAEAAEEVADVVELLHRMERSLERVEVLISSTLGGVGLVAAGVLATVLKVYLG